MTNAMLLVVAAVFLLRTTVDATCSTKTDCMQCLLASTSDKKCEWCPGKHVHGRFAILRIEASRLSLIQGLS
jgi:hypothetical protein